jgi:hypothetical protein
MATYKLSGVTLELQPATLGTGALGAAVPTPGDINSTGKTLNVSGNFKIGDKAVANFFQGFPLTAEELSKTTLDGLDALAESKVAEFLGVKLTAQ